MTLQIAFLFALVGVAMVFFATEWVEADVTALGLLIAMVLGGVVPAEKAFPGFGSDTVIMILGLLIMTAALMRTGVMDLVGRWIVRHAGDRPGHLQGVVMGGAAALSAFMSNTAATAFFVPVAFGVAKRAKFSPSKLLMPLAFATILAGSITLIGTSTNLVVSGLLTQYKLAPMGMFELASVGLPITIAGLVYMMTLGRKIIPDRFRPEETGRRAEALRSYLSEILVLPGSRLSGKTIAGSGLGRDLDLTALRILRDKTQSLPARAETMIHEGDVCDRAGASRLAAACIKPNRQRSPVMRATDEFRCST